MSNKDVVTNEYSLLFGDCLERMKEIPDGSVDMVLVDLPYGTTSCAWDSIIPFEPMWKELKRIIKQTKPVVMFGSEPFSSALRMSNIAWYKYDWIWCKNRPTGFAHAKNKPMKKHETVSVFSNGTTVHAIQSKVRMPYFPQGLEDIEPKRVTKKQSEKTDTFFADRPSHREFTRSKTGYPHSLLEYSTDNLGLHPTAKPVALLEYLIKTYTQENETVLDFTFGSCSTGVACLNTNRKFIGVEMDDKYFDIGVKRMQESTIKGDLK
jgi:site-specific DNA-methyltransferase (adenine-specific)